MTTRFQRAAYWFLFLLLATRLAAMAWIPLTDDTEARYGDVARRMVENGNWVTPMSVEGAFWAKPPLSTWVSAISMHLFGVNAFASRLPNLLLMILTLGMMSYLITRKTGRRDAGLFTLLVGSSMLLTYLAAGTVMTDTTLVFSTTWGLLAFWMAKETGLKRWGYLMFAGLGVGLLAKGPVAIVLTGAPIFFWALWQREFKASLKCLPWVGGILLMLLIAVPWYLMAEHRTPGFLRYFLVGENIERFINPGWTGDKYGSAHLHPMGTIWVYWLAAAFPWTLAIPVWLKKTGWQGVKKQFDKDHSLARYLLLAALMPELFFTTARNIIATYPLVGLPPLAALIALVVWEKHPLVSWRLPSLSVITSLFGVMAVLAFCVLPTDYIPKNSQKPIVEAWLRERPTPTTPLAYYDTHYYSAYFYADGHIGYLENGAALVDYLKTTPHAFVAFRNGDVKGLSQDIKDQLTLVYRSPVVTLMMEKDQTGMTEKDHAGTTP